MRKLAAWLDERTGLGGAWRSFAAHPVPGGARWAYVLGSVLVFLLGLQAITGVAMATVYAPAATTAWASVVWLEQGVGGGWLLRRLHQGGASAMIIVTGLHVAQVALWGAYRRPREVNWWSGLVLMLLLFGFALTGYLLPWDQKGYWATQVATNLVGALPLVGRGLRALLVGGEVYGTATLGRFYALHVFVLPALTVLVVLGHVALMRRHHVTSWWRVSARERERHAEPFWPGQALRDVIGMGLMLAALLAWAAWQRRGGALVLEAPADAGSPYDARPEWYFLPLYQLLKYFPGRWELVGAVGVPALVFGFLFALPLLDRGASAAPLQRKRWLGGLCVVGAGAAALAGLALRADAHSRAYQRARVQAEAQARRALGLAQKGVPPAGGTAVYDNDPLELGRRVYRERCVGCHILDGAGERKAPDLDGWSTRAWLRRFLADPNDAHFFGATKIKRMKPVKADAADLDALVEWIFAQGEEGATPAVDAAKVERGRALFADKGCDDCHESDGTTDGDGVPNLGGRGTSAWLRALMRDASQEHLFGKKNEMPRFADKLAPDELEAVVALMRQLRAAPEATP